MKYILIDQTKTDCFDEEFETAEEAVKRGEREWDYLTEREKEAREAFYILESANPDPEAEDHYDGDYIKRWK